MKVDALEEPYCKQKNYYKVFLPSYGLLKELPIESIGNQLLFVSLIKDEIAGKQTGSQREQCYLIFDERYAAAVP